MCDTNSSRLAALIEENKELNARFEQANANFWKNANDQRAELRAEVLKKQQAGHHEQA